MYRLILADDEADVREGVLQEIDWENNGFEVADRAENGREALEMAERCLPDVLVTDIRMPFMDGLELAERVRGLRPDTKIIILTGYDEFEYARQAIRLQIAEFVLKPFSKEELLQALRKVKAELDRERALREDMDSLKEHYRRSLPLLRELFLGSLATRSLSEREIGEKLAAYDLKLPADGRHLAAAARLDLPADAGDVELHRFAVRNIAEEIAERRRAGLVFQHDGHVVLLSSSGEAGPDWPAGFYAALEEIRQSVEKYLKLTVTIGVSGEADGLRNVRYSYEEAAAALDYRLLLGSNRLIPIGDVEAREAAPLRYDEQQEQALIRCLKFGTEEEMTETVEKHFAAVRSLGPDAALQSVQLFLLQIAATLMRAAQDTGKDLGGLFGGGNPQLLGELSRIRDLDEAQAWVVRIARSVMSRIAADRQTAYNRLVEQAKEYTKAHFADSGLSIAEVCARLHISAGYFSSIFKKETKLTYVQYLQQLRMDTAKELLAQTDLKAFEIAEKVGYADPNYFSFSFKKQVGLSPKEYRAGLRKEETK
ncbi:response regulator [Cohnella zeiphila]|uniref:Response regulator n=1 Tax=Cohnella zeiphila TaxID=2761120 RepID=A0A7X0SP51_9BACL|nr:response regulator [Cohnella zeiphila]MBB6732449.1 response regulator [Cohnella zeiphila]